MYNCGQIKYYFIGDYIIFLKNIKYGQISNNNNNNEKSHIEKSILPRPI